MNIHIDNAIRLIFVEELNIDFSIPKLTTTKSKERQYINETCKWKEAETYHYKIPLIVLDEVTKSGISRMSKEISKTINLTFYKFDWEMVDKENFSLIVTFLL